MDFNYSSSEDRTTGVLSPVFNRNDKSFIYNINNFIENELLLLKTDYHKQHVFLLKEKFLVFKQAFSKVFKKMKFFFLIIKTNHKYTVVLSNLRRDRDLACFLEAYNSKMVSQKNSMRIQLGAL